MPITHVYHTISGQGTGISTLDHSATTPKANNPQNHSNSYLPILVCHFISLLISLSDAFVVVVWCHQYVTWHTYVSLWRNLEGSALWRQIFNILTASLNSYSYRVYSKSLFPLMSHHLSRNRSGFQVTVATTLTYVQHLYLLYFALYINRSLLIS